MLCIGIHTHCRNTEINVEEVAVMDDVLGLNRVGVRVSEIVLADYTYVGLEPGCVV